MKRSEPLHFDTAIAQLCSPAWAPSGTHVATSQSDEVLRALLPASRREEGRVALGASPGAIANLVSVLRDPIVFHETLGHHAIRILRNLCVRSPANQTRAAECSTHILVIDSLANVLAAESSISDQKRTIAGGSQSTNPSRLCTPFYGFAVEFLVNFVTGNEQNSELVWVSAFPTVLDQLLRCDNEAAAAATGALIHNCIVAAPHRMPDLVAYFPSQGDHTNSAQKTLLHTLVSLMQDEESSGKDEERFSWSFHIIRRLIRASMMRLCFDALGSPLDEITISTKKSFSKLQHTFLSIVDAGASKSAESTNTSDVELFSVPESSLSFFGDLVESAFMKKDGTLLRVIGSIIGSIVIIDENSTALDDLRQRMVKVAVNVLHALTMREHTGDNSGGEIPAGNGSRINVSELNANEQELRGIKAIMVRAIAVCCDECPTAQDQVRNLLGIPVVLSALTYERDITANPFLREWAVLAIRNLTFGNEENAKEISSLEFVGMRNHELLEQAGLEAFMDDKTGRPRLRQKQRP